MQFLVTILPNNGLALSLGGWRNSLWKILDPPLVAINTYTNFNIIIVGVLDDVLTLAAADMSGSNRWCPLTSGSCCWTSMMAADHRWCLKMCRDLSSACSTPLAIQQVQQSYGKVLFSVLCVCQSFLSMGGGFICDHCP